MTACQSATTGDLQRAAQFLEGARKVRQGCTKQRRASRARPTKAQKEIDIPVSW